MSREHASGRFRGISLRKREPRVAEGAPHNYREAMLLSRRSLSAALFVIPLAVLPACGSKQTTTDAVVDANRRLDGTWVLRSYTPDQPLEAPLQSLLAVQFGAMYVRFDGQNLYATGPGVNVTRRYQITEAAGDQLSLMIYEQTGVWYRTSAQFQGNLLHFRGYDSPWRGAGVLERTVQTQ